MLLIELKTKNLELEAKIAAYEQLICSNESFLALLEERELAIEALHKQKAKTEASLDAALKRIETLEKRNYELNKILSSAFKTLKLKDTETGILNEYLEALKMRSCLYTPLPEDAVDARLAEYLNGLSDPRGMAELFKREGAGVYHFGTKRVFIKLENNKIASSLCRDG